MTAKSAVHHWFPIGLQQYWKDKNGDISIMSPSGEVTKKRARKNNNKIGYKRHAHTLSKGNKFWEFNFEHLFNIDGVVHSIVERCEYWDTNAGRFELLWSLIRNFRRLRRLPKALSNSAVYQRMTKEKLEEIILFSCLLVLRSPRTHSVFGAYSIFPDQDQKDEVGRANIHQAVHNVLNAFDHKNIPFLFVTIIHPNRRSFIFGDGCYETFSHSTLHGTFSGEALVPLTPDIAVFLRTVRSRPSETNIATLIAEPWLVEQINNLTQVYSGTQLFFRGSEPKLHDTFRVRQFRRVDGIPVAIKYLREVADHAPFLSGGEDYRVGGQRNSPYSRQS